MKNDLRRWFKDWEPRMAPSAAQPEGTVRTSKNALSTFKVWCISAFAFCPMAGAVCRTVPIIFRRFSFFPPCPGPRPLSDPQASLITEKHI